MLYVYDVMERVGSHVCALVGAVSLRSTACNTRHGVRSEIKEAVFCVIAFVGISSKCLLPRRRNSLKTS